MCRRRHLSVLLPFVAVVLSGHLAKASKAAAPSPREMVPLTTWQFTEDRETKAAEIEPPKQAQWSTVAVPHVFRQSGLPDESAGWYRQTLTPAASERNRRVYLILEGAASVKDVFVNGQHVGQHRGPFSACAFDLTPALKAGQPNTLDVRVTNRTEERKGCFAPPSSNLYYVNGGMFRKAWLMRTGAVHIFPDMGSRGVYLTPANITKSSADLNARTVVRNPLSATVEVVVHHTVLDQRNRACAEFEAKQSIPADETVTIRADGKVTDPLLWDIGKPNLYTVRTEIRVDGKLADAVTERVGFRTIEWKNNRFSLNGREVQFRGVNKHAQNEYAWNAVADDELRREWQWIVDMGANMVRLAHYPHSRLEYDIADERGIVVWAENGYAGQLWEKGPDVDGKTVSPDGERLTREMVRQNWNHPSILFWSAGNETIVDVVGHYAEVIRKENDPTRLVTYAAAGAQKPKNCDFIAYNTYDGWYTSGPYTDFAKNPLNELVSETGAGDWITHHISYGTIKWTVDRYEPEEYSEMFTEYRLQTICRNEVEKHKMCLWWSCREFYNLKFKNNRNTKGLYTMAGAPKDIAFLFRAFYNPAEPVVHLCGRNHFLRAFAPDNGIKAYSNARQLQLTLNGVAGETIANGSYRIPDAEMKQGNRVRQVPGIPVENVFFWKTPLRAGRNIIEVSDGQGHSDRMIVYQKGGGKGDSPIFADTKIGTVPSDMSDPGALVQDLASSNGANPAVFIDRPVEAQGPVYADVDGSSDNTFDILPQQVEGAAWIATRRLSDPKLKTDLGFRVNPSSKGVAVFVMFSTGEYPIVTLKKPDGAIKAAAEAMRRSLAAAGFRSVATDAVWRDHQLNRVSAELWSRDINAGEGINISGQTLDYVVMIRSTKGIE